MSRFVVIGHSHLIALDYAARERTWPQSDEFHFVQLRERQYRHPSLKQLPEPEQHRLAERVTGVALDRVRAALDRWPADVGVLCLSGNEPFALGLKGHANGTATHEAKLRSLTNNVPARLREWVECLRPQLPATLLVYPPMPPVACDDLQAHFPPERTARFRALSLESRAFRLQAWQHFCSLVQAECEKLGLHFVAPPADVFEPDGLLGPTWWSDDPGHANEAYGERMLQQLTQAAHALPTAPRPHPYAALEDRAFWRQAVSELPPEAVDPVDEPTFRIATVDRIATAGSCFAQHIAARLRRHGFHFLQTEPHDPADAAEFSARYGNVYTARQLLQLFERAHGTFHPQDSAWQRADGRWCDPFRPRIEPAGYESPEAVAQAREPHLRAVRELFATADFLVFTLGLTECWLSRRDGAAYPVAPGTAAGVYDPTLHRFERFSVTEVQADMERFLALLAEVNPRVRVILTVSPVPLVATASGEHVLSATVHAKAVLRVAAGELARRHAQVFYFPAYEVVTGPHAPAHYFEADRRTVSPRAVDHVMRLFLSRLTDVDPDTLAEEDATEAPETDASPAPTDEIARIQRLADEACDELVLARKR